MDFSKRLDIIIETIKCSNADLAKISGIDPSLISRYRNATRIPAAMSKQFILLCNGIAIYTVNNNLWNELVNICKLTEANSPSDSIRQFLQTTDNHNNTNDNILPNTPPMLFGDKLTRLMNLLDISNMKLAKALNLDASLISRIKNGKRVPKKKSDFTKDLSHYFYKVIETKGISEEKKIFLGVCPDFTTFEQDKFSEYFLDWLYSSDEITYTIRLDKVMKYTDKLSLYSTISSDLNEYNLPQIKIHETFHRYTDLKDAIHALIYTLMNSKCPGIVKVYSDQKIDWTKKSWIHLLTEFMYPPLIKKYKFKIIHNTETNSNEIFPIIEALLPLYMTGSAEGFYVNSPRDSLFSHFCIIVPEIAAIVCSNVVGTEDNCIYYYLTDKDNINFYNIQFNALLKKSKPLVYSYKNKSYEYFYSNLCNITIKPSIHTLLLPYLSNIVMPIELLKKQIMQCKSNLEETKINIILGHQAFLNQLFQKNLAISKITLYAVLPDLRTLNSGKVTYQLLDTFSNNPIVYTAKDYKEYIRHIIMLLGNDNFELKLLSESVLDHMCVFSINPDYVIIKHYSGNIISIKCDYVLDSFVSFIKESTKNYLLPFHKKNEVIKHLETYLLNLL